MRASNECVECCWLIPTFCISIFVLVFGSLLIAQVTDPANEFFVNDIYAAPGHRYGDIGADSEQCFVILHPRSFRGDQLLLYKVNAESETLEMGYTYDVSLDDNVVPGEVDDEINTAIDDTQDETGFGGDVGSGGRARHSSRGPWGFRCRLPEPCVVLRAVDKAAGEPRK